MKHAHNLLPAVVACLLASTAFAQDWPQWRGPNRDGKAAAFTAPQNWPKTLVQKWKVAVGEGVATPALAGDRLYVFSRQDNNEVIRCLDAATGKEIWIDKYESQGVSGPAARFSGPRSSPAVAEGKVVTLGVRGIVSCLDAATGTKLWRKDDFQGATPRFATACSPMIVDGLCILQLGGDSGAVVAYNLADGREKWRWAGGDGASYSSPVLMTAGNARLVVVMTERRVVGISLADGKLAWETPFVVQGMRGYNACTPIIADARTVVFSGGGRGTIAVTIDKQNDAFVAKQVWTNPDKAVQFNTPVARDGMLYGLSATDELFCLNLATGQTLWGTPIGGRGAAGQTGPAGAAGDAGRRGPGMGGPRPGFGSIVDAGTVLAALTPAMDLVVFKPDGKQYAEVARMRVAQSPTYAHPLLSGNRIFIKDEDSVILWTLE